MNRTLAIIGAVVLIGGVILSNSYFIVDQTKQTLVLRFGEPVREILEPGLQFKIPFIEETVFYERRALDVDPPRQQVILSDQKRLDVDSYARYTITDPLEFFRSVRTEREAASRLSNIINSSLRRVLGNQTLLQVLIEVRIRRADYPDATRENVYNRMISEREREAAQFRAEGSEQAQKIRADADKQRTIVIAEAKKQAETLRGEGDGQAIKIYADAFGQDPDFFAFYRSMQAYRTALSAGDTTLVLNPDSDFFRFFNSMGGAPAAE